MISQKLRSALGIALAIGVGIAMQATPGSAQDQQQPPAEADQAAPADAGAAGASDTLPSTEQAAPSAEPAQDGGASTTEAPAGATEPSSGGSAGVQPTQPEAPAAEAGTEAPVQAASAVSASDLKIGAAVYGADGAKIGEVNGVKSDDAGKVQEILVTDGVAAGINAKVFAISADKITSVSDGVKLSLSSEETKKLPIIDNSNG
ncbi:PRC-barrel domain-containing protein [Hyphomicrobium sp. 99]|uniref:PRC-barrel domain-containing protein n=1 Tax=Hyphomicrobium sp. 99 TaxID=1163419 RepID=UPI000697C1A4|nr:PRC-barrel domain-containing protein [Hyphomicrobium sp. 99]